MNRDKECFNKIDNLKNSIGNYDYYCDGYGNNHISGNSYVLGTVLSTAQVKKQFSHEGSQTLDFINAFDKAEVAETNLGKINMITVSSFCGPQGLILGYDLLPVSNIEDYRIPISKHPNTKIYSLDPLLISTKALIGTIEKPVFPIIPGAHMSCAGRHIEAVGPCILYAALGIGISKGNSGQDALLMEDAGYLIGASDQEVIENLVGSIMEVGLNQRTNYETIFVGMKKIEIKDGMVGCALVQAPYLILPKKSITQPEEIIKMNLESWIESVGSKIGGSSLN